MIVLYHTCVFYNSMSFSLLFLMILLPPISTRTDKLFPYTTLFRSQLLVWNSYGTGHANADTIRRVIANETIKSTDPVAILGGEDRYAEAGGKIDRDLFSDSADTWVNPQIAQRLAADLLEAEDKRVGQEHWLARLRTKHGREA